MTAERFSRAYLDAADFHAELAKSAERNRHGGSATVLWQYADRLRNAATALSELSNA